LFTSSRSHEPSPRGHRDQVIHDAERLDERKDPVDEPAPLTCGFSGCSLEAVWRQYDPADRSFPHYICTHHRSYMLIRNPEAVLLYGWIGLFPEGRVRRPAAGEG
jgi:hypothetical protein